jgi:serine/threonine-protein kinase HipA
MISGLTLLRASEHVTDRSRWSYPLLADEIRRLDREQLNSRIELYRRMVLNALITNSDDHPRNHALIADQNGWRLSPAFDLTPTPTIAVENRYLAMTVGTRGRLASRDNLLSQSERFGLKAEPAGAVIGQLRGIVENRWYPVCRAAGVNETDCEAIRSAFVHADFHLDVTQPEPPAAASTNP